LKTLTVHTGEEAAALVKKTAAPKRFRVAFLSQEDPADQRTWSGITFHLHRQISRFHEVTWVHAADLPVTKRRLLSLWNRAADMLGWKFTTHYFLNAFFLSKGVQKKIAGQAFDFIVVGAGESELIAYLKTTAPIIYIADSTFGNMVNYYPWHTGLCRLALQQGNAVEKAAISNAAHLIYSSAWAAASAVNNYDAPAAKVSVVDFGANLAKLPAKEEALRGKENSTCRLLFLGVSWERKGGDIAYKTFIDLKKKGIKCTLTIVGCNPVLEKDTDLTIIPFLDKNKNSDFEQLYTLLLQSHFLIVPTRADCTPIVFCEAAAFGVPVITTDTGGISSVIKEGLNGFCLPMEAGEKDYSNLLEELWLDRSKYDRLRETSREQFDERLNWNTWMEKFSNILNVSARKK
jgi:glycosyltransferase involved in cell wall biosynthesis